MSPDNETPRVIAGRYTLDAQVGRGGMGVVWRGEDRMLGREVALKKIGLMPGGAEPDLVRAEREAQLAARLNHPHIVAVFDLVADGDAQWLVMEYVPGQTLGQMATEQGPLDPERARVVLAQAADALAAAHAAGILHRDVKPSNILVRNDGSVKLTDFGIARATADVTLTQTGLVTGSPAYLAPEVASGGRASAASDVWALGATLYHALEGRPPYDMGGNVMAGMYQIVHGPEPRSDRAGMLTPLLEHTLVKDPESRWSMDQVRAALADPRRLDEARSAGTDTVATTAVPPTRVAPAAPVASLVSRATERHRPEDDDEDYEAEPVWTTVDTGTSHRPTGDEPPVIAPAPRTRRSSPRRRRGLAVAALVAGLALVAFLGIGLVTGLLGGDGDETASEDPSTSSSTEASESAEASPSQTPSADTETVADRQRAFVTDYLETATTDTQASWQMLTPGYQRESGGFGSYDGFWSLNQSAQVSEITPDPANDRVSYTVSYGRAGGETTSPERVTLQLVPDGDSFLIADQL
ncbi:serine/threonine protein kinase [Nocardioides sp. HDW12B]|uniref:serine/threonine-protein kinase n=1 Tax=Nocardioides sp. HDW12B TaxID=2714939 RepID=UPI0014088A65|nr:serine/threonine-protein kinase [Nocardioides sp. HDW12B]QIK65757.1 serine/threonine protein kinase [Nocardioides sp. HDW12B]